MRHKLLSSILIMGVLFGCSRLEYSKRTPASRSVGLVGPDGEMILFYKAGDYIIVKSCDPSSIWGMTGSDAQSNCQGRSNKVPIEAFKQALRRIVSFDRLNVLKPLTPEEVETIPQIQAMTIELNYINTFIKTYGAESVDLVSKKELVEALHSQENLARVIQKINSELEKTFDLILDNDKLNLANFDSEKDEFLYTVLKNFNQSQNPPCGLKGSVDERVRECSYLFDSKKEGFVLVTRTKEFKEIYKQSSTGLLWSDPLSSTMTQSHAQKSCKEDFKDLAGISGLSWRLPSKEEYEQAEKDGIRKTLPNMDHWFWSSTMQSDGSEYAWYFSGGLGYTSTYFYKNYGYITARCVSR